VAGKKLVDIQKHLVGGLAANLAMMCNIQKGEFDHRKNGA